MTIFISHISEEAAIALVLKRYIENVFPKECKVFVSSDSENIPAGSKWLDQIDTALNETKLLIILCSSNSISKPWINFEAGCGWIKKIPIIPICYSGVTKENLPTPLSLLQGINFLENKYHKKLFGSIRSHLDVKPAHKIDFEEFDHDIRRAIADSTNITEEYSKQKAIAKEIKDIRNIEVEILKKLAETNGRSLTAVQLANILGTPLEKIKYFLGEMLNKNFIYDSISMGSPAEYSLDQAGRKFLIDKNLL